MKVSFIIPIYKVEQYLHQCVESVTAQTYSDIEVILVDDGSPDGSPALCDALALEDTRIRVIHKQNGGLSDARNTGLKSATGEYVVFVDGDDFWLDSYCLQNLVDTLKNNPDADFIGFNCNYYYPNEERYTQWLLFPSSIGELVNKDIALCQLVKAGIFPVSACMKFIKRDFIINNQLFFKVGQLSEDIPWFINLIDACDKCLFVNQFIYAYRQVSGGSSISHNIGIRNVNCLIEIINNELSLLSQRSFNDEAKDALRSFLAYELIQAYTCIPSLNKGEAKIVYQELKKYDWLFAYTQNPKVKKVKLMRRFLGLKLTIRALRLYVKYR